ncbi:MAG: CrcB family protein [Myxococcales bacterium]|nr:CrcB family protein [Myxococcales bacterium]
MISPGLAVGVAVAGGLGSLGRYAVASALAPVSGRWPWGTLVVNLVGAALIGLVVAVCASRPDGGRERVVLATGFLGGFTTFSSLALETVELIDRRAWFAVTAYVTVTVVCGVAACAAGLALGGMWRR